LRWEETKYAARITLDIQLSLLLALSEPSKELQAKQDGPVENDNFSQRREDEDEEDEASWTNERVSMVT
jgi:hypothetical protein